MVTLDTQETQTSRIDCTVAADQAVFYHVIFDRYLQVPVRYQARPRLRSASRLPCVAPVISGYPLQWRQTTYRQEISGT